MSRRPWLTLSLLFGAGLAHASPPPVFGPELDLDRPVLTGAVGDQTVAAAAFDGERFLVAWRSSLWKPELRVGRVTVAGDVLDPRGLLLDGFERIEGTVAVASGGGAFLVAWANEPGRIRASRVAVEGGKLVASPTVTLTEGAVTTVMIGPAVTWNGAAFWVMWGQSGDAPGVYALRVSPAGQALDATPLKLADGAAEPALVGNGAQVLAGWAMPGAGGVVVRLVHLRADGTADLPAVAILTIPGEKAGPLSLAWNGSQFLVTGAGLDAGGAQTVRAVRLSAELHALDVGGLDVAAPPGTAAGGPTALGTAGGFTVLWASATMEGNRSVPRLGGSQISDGKPAALAPFGWSKAGQMPFLASASTEPFVFWSEAGWWTDEGLMIDLDVQAGPLGGGRPPALVSRGVNAQTRPVVALGPHQIFVAWEDRRGDRQHGDVYGARLDGDGTMLDEAGLPLGLGEGAQTDPAVAWDGQEFVAVWHDGRRGLAMARVNTVGEILDRPPAVIPGTADQQLLGEPALCGDSDGALLVWGARAPGAASAQIRGLRLPGSGVIDRPGAVLVETADAEDAPVVRLGCNQQAAVLVWSGHMVAKDGAPLSMLHLARGGLVPTAPPVVLQPAEGDEWAGIGSDGTNFLIAWRNFDGQGRRTVVGQRVSAEGKLLEDRPFRIGLSNSGQRVTVLWDGAQYLVFAINTANGNPFELRARRVGPRGEPLEADWIPVSYLAQPWAGTGNGSDAVLLRPGHSFLVYDRYFDDDATGNIRIRGRFIESTAPDPPDAGADASPDAAAASTDAAPIAPALSKASGCACNQASGRPSFVLVLVLVLVLGRLLDRPRQPLRRIDHSDDR
jgi:hypothetical protein